MAFRIELAGWVRLLHCRLYDDDYVRRELLTIPATWWRCVVSDQTSRRVGRFVYIARGWHSFPRRAYNTPPLRRPSTMDEQSLDRTTLATISLLEARLLRIEQILHGSQAGAVPRPAGDSAIESLANLERRFATLISRFRVYADILKLCTSPPVRAPALWLDA